MIIVAGAILYLVAAFIMYNAGMNFYERLWAMMCIIIGTMMLS